MREGARGREGGVQRGESAIDAGQRAGQLCDRLAIIDGGLIVRQGTPAELKADLRSRWNGNGEPTLDDVFLDATGRTRDRAAGEVQEVSA